MYKDLCAEEAFNFLKNGKYGVARDRHNHVYLAPIIKEITLEKEQTTILGERQVGLFGRAVNINNSYVLVVDGALALFALEHAFFLCDSERESLEKKLGFKIPNGRCGTNLSQEELEELGCSIQSTS